MNRMWDKNDIIKLIEEYASGFDPSEIPEGVIDAVLGLNADGEAVKGNLDGKYVKIVDPIPLHTPLTDEQLDNIVQGCFVNGVMGGNMFNPVIFPAAEDGVGGKWGIMFARPYPLGTHFLCRVYHYNQSTKHLSFLNYFPFTFYMNGLAIQGEQLPTNPSNGSYKAFAFINNQLSWIDLSTNIAPEYDSTAIYSIDSLVFHQGLLYQCSTAVTTPEEWDAAKWTQTTLAAVIAAL